jgi:imidazolonepropionase-like amidohydrolase
MDDTIRVRGADWFDVATGMAEPRDLLVDDGRFLPDDGRAAREIDGSGLTAMFGLWDCHAHPGGLMYDIDGTGWFESPADRTIRAGLNLQEAVRMGITGVRCVDETDGIDLAWSRWIARGDAVGPRVLGAGRGIRTTAGHGTRFPRSYSRLEGELVADGPDEMVRAVRTELERGAHWIKIMLTGGLMSEHETVDGGQFTEAELAALMEIANLRGIPVAAHCGGSEPARMFSKLGGRSVEHGYRLDEEAAAIMAEHGTWLVPTVSVTHDQEYIAAEGWPEHAAARSRAAMPLHADALMACVEAGVSIAVGADLNPIGPRLHRELAMLERAGLDRLSVLGAATVGGRELNGLGGSSTPEPGLSADVILVEGDPLTELEPLSEPVLVLVSGRVAHHDGLL